MWRRRKEEKPEGTVGGSVAAMMEEYREGLAWDQVQHGGPALRKREV